MRVRHLIVPLCTFLAGQLHAVQYHVWDWLSPTHTAPRGEYAPWFTGPLIAPSGHIVPAGYVYFEPYVYAYRVSNVYDGDWKKVKVPTSWSVQFWNPIETGLTKWLDVIFSPQYYYNVTETASAFVLADWYLGLDFQLLRDTPTGWWPAIRMGVLEYFPMGKYDRLDPKRGVVDAGGLGTYTTSIELVISRLFHIYHHVWLSLRLYTAYNIPTPVRVHGLSVYGGGPDTDGTVYVPQSLDVDFGMELSLSQNWVLACDIQAFFVGSRHFKGYRGVTLGLPDILSLGPQVQYSAAPAIEYNWSTEIGLIAGVWFTFAGKNTVDFVTPTIAYSYYY